MGYIILRVKGRMVEVVPFDLWGIPSRKVV